MDEDWTMMADSDDSIEIKKEGDFDEDDKEVEAPETVSKKDEKDGNM